MEKFIYVYSEDARDTLIKANFKLLKSDDRNHIYIFENANPLNGTQKFALNNVSNIPSNTLTF